MHERASHATPNEPRNVLVESQVIMPLGIGTLAVPSLVRAQSPRRRRRVGAGETAAGPGADSCARPGASVEASSRGGQIPIRWGSGRSGGRHSQLRQPPVAADAAGAGRRPTDLPPRRDRAILSFLVMAVQCQSSGRTAPARRCRAGRVSLSMMSTFQLFAPNGARAERASPSRVG
jgi:hypothetical protein